MDGSRPYDVAQDGYRYRPDHIAALEERITMSPVPPAEIRERGEDATLVTTDVPDYLDSGIAPDADTAVVLYRLVQLFGTPNVPGMEAGADQGSRERVTWQYLFRVVDEPTPEDDAETERREYLLSVYDDKTNVSVGLSAFQPHEEGAPVPEGDRVAVEPTGDPLPSGMYEEEYLRDVVRLVLSSVEHAVEATYKGLHV